MAALARWCFQRRAWVLAGWLALLVILGAGGRAAGPAYSDTLTLPGTGSTAALHLEEQAFPGHAGDQDTIIWRAGGGVRAPAVEEVKRLLPVPRDVQLVADLVVLEGLAGHQLVTRIVLDEQYLNRADDHAVVPSLVLAALPELATACSAGRSGSADMPVSADLIPGSVKQTRAPPA